MIFLASSTSSIIQNAMKNHTKTTVDEVTKSNAYMIKIDEIWNRIKLRVMNFEHYLHMYLVHN